MFDDAHFDRNAGEPQSEADHRWRRGELVDNSKPDNQPIRAGYGNCTASYCTCGGFMGSNQLCANCGHNYSFHS